jgi:transposase-like protein
MITDKLRSYGAARQQVMPHVEHRSHKGLNNRAENSHVPLRKRERMMQSFRSPGGLQRFISTTAISHSLASDTKQLGELVGRFQLNRRKTIREPNSTAANRIPEPVLRLASHG